MLREIVEQKLIIDKLPMVIDLETWAGPFCGAGSILRAFFAL